jgi:enoyl-CoA hydratase
MKNSILLSQEKNGVAVIRFNRPFALNALDLEAMLRFRHAVRSLSQDSQLKAVILCGAGEDAFCSGGDLVELRDKLSEGDARHFITIMGEALLSLERLLVPVIAAITGYALGGGSEIALACDMRIVDAKVKMGMVQINMAVTPGWGAGQRLLRLLGYAKSMELLLKGEVLRADELLSLGLANEVTEQGMAFERALSFANEIAARPPKVVKGIKALLQAGLQQSYHKALYTEKEIFPPLWVDEAHVQALEDFFKRQADKRQES